MLEIIGRAKAFTIPPLKFVEGKNLTGSGGIIYSVLTWVLTIAAVVAVIYLVYGGLLYITAGGDAEKATKGRTALINAIIGIIIIALAILIVTWVSSIINGNTNV